MRVSLYQRQAPKNAHRSERDVEDRESSTLSGSSPSSLSMAHTERASRTDSDHSALCKDYNQILSAQQQHQWQTGAQINPSAPNQITVQGMPLTVQENSDDGSCTSMDSPRTSFDTNASVFSPVDLDFSTKSPMFRKASPFPWWSTHDEFLGQPDVLDLTAQFMQAQHYGPFPDGSLVQPMHPEPNVLNFAEGTITPRMLDCNGYNPSSQMNNIIFGSETRARWGGHDSNPLLGQKACSFFFLPLGNPFLPSFMIMA